MYSEKQYYHLWTEIGATGVVVLLMVSKSDYSLVVVLSEPLAPLNGEFTGMSNTGLNFVYFI